VLDGLDLALVAAVVGVELRLGAWLVCGCGVADGWLELP
jgi:hypothetical protein